MWAWSIDYNYCTASVFLLPVTGHPVPCVRFTIDRPLPTHVQCRNTFPSVHSVLRKLAPFAFLTSTVAHREREKKRLFETSEGQKAAKTAQKLLIGIPLMLGSTFSSAGGFYNSSIHANRPFGYFVGLEVS